MRSLAAASAEMEVGAGLGRRTAAPARQPAPIVLPSARLVRRCAGAQQQGSELGSLAPRTAQLGKAARSARLVKASASPGLGIFPAGRKQATVKLPALILELTASEVDERCLDEVSRCIAAGATAVVLREGAGGATALYEAACTLRETIRGRAMLLLVDRTDIATAASADGVLLTDQGEFGWGHGGWLKVHHGGPFVACRVQTGPPGAIGGRGGTVASNWPGQPAFRLLSRGTRSLARTHTRIHPSPRRPQPHQLSTQGT
jgi:hypothetical protein